MRAQDRALRARCGRSGSAKACQTSGVGVGYWDNRTLRALHRRVQAVDPPMPSDDASDGAWDAWADLQDLQAILTGLASSRESRSASVAGRSEWRETVTAHLAKPSVVALLGDAADDARSLAAALGVLRTP